MAKIDTTTIEGYADMSAEQKLAALEAYEMPEQPAQDEVTRLKTALSKSNSEAADWKRQFREKQTEAERKEAERQEKDAALREELNTLKHEKAVATYKARYAGLGYDADLAEEAAVAMANGDMEAVFAAQARATEAHANAIKAGMMKAQPDLTAGKPATEDVLAAEETNRLRKAFGLYN